MATNRITFYDPSSVVNSAILWSNSRQLILTGGTTTTTIGSVSSGNYGNGKLTPTNIQFSGGVNTGWRYFTIPALVKGDYNLDLYTSVTPLYTETPWATIEFAWTGSTVITDGFVDQISIDGKTLQQAMMIIGAIIAGKVSGAGSPTETFKGLDGVTDRVTVDATSAGNRTTVNYLLPP